ncbi:hypothetical protein REPUB_Repub08aG0219600 [Reevesia pubescens]
MIEIKSEIVSRQTIKPSTPTPSDLKTFKLSLLDQISPGVHGNMTFFYPSDGTIDSIADDFSEKSKLLRDSISKTLSLFYPLGGRLQDAAIIDCNDEVTKVLSFSKPKSTFNYLSSLFNLILI